MTFTKLARLGLMIGCLAMLGGCATTGKFAESSSPMGSVGETANNLLWPHDVPTLTEQLILLAVREGNQQLQESGQRPFGGQMKPYCLKDAFGQGICGYYPQVVRWPAPADRWSEYKGGAFYLNVVDGVCEDTLQVVYEEYTTSRGAGRDTPKARLARAQQALHNRLVGCALVKAGCPQARFVPPGPHDMILYDSDMTNGGGTLTYVCRRDDGSLFTVPLPSDTQKLFNQETDPATNQLLLVWLAELKKQQQAAR